VILYPAIDILGGRAVRLTKGDFGASKVYDEDPLEAARAWVEGGAEYLHVVDLDGAREGHPQNFHHLKRICELGVPVQLGGGLRGLTIVEDAFEMGAERVILGTAAFTDPRLLDEVLGDGRWRDRVLVSVDLRDGRVATAGWQETIDGDVKEVIGQLWSRGVHEFVYTNVDRDGMLGGPSLEDVRRVADLVEQVGGQFLYSGGIGRLADLEALAGLQTTSLAGVIVGKALYEGCFTIAEARAALGDDRLA
jgi:phosphoribosylformimino-5-aminoimidazole carboxamide ribotide isomerase